MNEVELLRIYEAQLTAQMLGRAPLDAKGTTDLLIA